MNDAEGDPNLVKQQIENLNSDLNVTSGNDQADNGGGDGPDVEGVDDRALHCYL
jgi:hypothetical protein